MVEAALKSKLNNFPKLNLRDNAKLYELVDISPEVQATKEDPTYSSLFSYFDSSSGILTILNKLSYNIQENGRPEPSTIKGPINFLFRNFPTLVNLCAK